MPRAAFPRAPRPHRRPRFDLLVDELVCWLAEGVQDRGILAAKMRLKDRVMRRTIEEARRRGVLIITTPGPLHTYAIAPSRAEYERWRKAEVLGRMGSLGAQLRAMDAAADRTWPAEQMRLGEA